MDFSPMIAALTEILAVETAAANPPATPIIAIGPALQLDTAALVAEAQQRKKANELSHGAKARRDKKVEKSRGYLDKLAAREKQTSTQRKKDHPKSKIIIIK
jgi:hypothetical protein